MSGGSVFDWIKLQQQARSYTESLKSLAASAAAGDAPLASVPSSVNGGLPEPYIAIILREVVRALAYLASRSQLHRDIKAANILLSRTSGKVKLADLGASKQLTHTMKQCSTLIGSPFWMAPEVVQQDKYDGSADVWSLGVTAIEMAQGAPPHAGQRLPAMQVMQLIAHCAPPTLPADDGRFSADLRSFVAACLVKDPAGRPSLNTLLKHPFLARAGKTAELKHMMDEIMSVHAQAQGQNKNKGK